MTAENKYGRPQLHNIHRQLGKIKYTRHKHQSVTDTETKRLGSTGCSCKL